jgi:excisionase family DNA binding protein
MTTEAKYIRVSEACRMFSLSRGTLYRMLENGDIDGDRTPGGHRRIRKESLEDYFTRGDKKVVALMSELGL